MKHKLHLLIIAILVYIHAITECTPASAHLHSHSRDLSNEREEDGSYRSRDHKHVSDDGEHHMEFDHEAILGSAKEAEEFDTLPPEEAKRRLAILVTKMDINNDKQIDRNELKAWIIRSFKSLSEEEAQERFEDADENEDGRVTWKEYLHDYTGGEEEQDISEEQIIADDKEIFETADLNKDGYLEFHEFVIFNHPEEHPETYPILLKHTLRDKDKNNDGIIDFQEYIGSRGYEQDKEWILSEKEKFENEFDQNKDGKLDTEEILSWIIPSNEEIAEEEVDHLFASSDDDHDNALSYNEIIEHHDIFVGSEATDYGQHLHKIDRDEL